MLLRRQDLLAARSLLDRTADKLNDNDVDIYQSMRMMTLKARMWEKAGLPQKGFSVALRAATLAHRARILPSLWEAICVICAVLHSVNEFKPSVQLLESILPQLLEYEAVGLTARAFLLLADAHVGLAGAAKTSTLLRQEHLTKGLQNLDEAFSEFAKDEDVQGQGQTLAKKATIMHLIGDHVLANDCAAQYLAIRKAARGNP